jgi:hypothetical protein
MCTKESAEYYKSILTNTYTGSMLSTGNIITKAIHYGIDQSVILAIQEILGIIPEKSSTNAWNSLTILLEFICCLLDSAVINKAAGSYVESFKETLKGTIIQIVFLEDFLYSPERRKFKNLYHGNKNTGVIKPYTDFILKDFLIPSKNTMCIIPPSVLLLLSIKLNPVINIPTNPWNLQLQNLLKYTRNECKNETINITVEKDIEEYLNTPPDNTITDKDSGLIETALLSISNSSETNNSENNLELENKTTLFDKMGRKSSELFNNIAGDIQKNTGKVKAVMSSIIDRIDIFKNKDPNRITILQNDIEILQAKINKLQQDLKTTQKTKRIFKLIKSVYEKIEDKIIEKNAKILSKQAEINQLSTSIDKNKENKLNYILSNILLLFGTGLRRINKDVCTLTKNNSSITWSTFDKTLKILDGKLFKIITFSSSKTLINLLIQNLVAYTTYFPFDIQSYFYEKLRLTKTEDIDKFKVLYAKYSTELFISFIHEDGYYYILSENDVEKRIINALSPPAEVLNEIKALVEQQLTPTKN